MITPQQLHSLQIDPEFQRVFAADPELKRLETLQYDESVECLLYSSAMHWSLSIGKLPIYALTPARWGVLYTCGNAYARNTAIKSSDLDVFLYVLSHPLDWDFTLQELPGAAADFAQTTQLPPAEIHAGIASIIRAMFSPLEQLPPETGNGEPVRYDTEWLLRITALAARESNQTLEYCKHHMSLGEVCILFVDYLKRNSTPDYARRIYRRHEPEIERRIMRRTRELHQEYLQSLRPK